MEKRKTPTNIKTLAFEKSLLDFVKKSSISVIRGFQINLEAEKRKSTKYQTSGNIDTDRLSQFRTAESIFTKKLIQSGQTNHGIFILQDLSGSMRKIAANAWLNMAIIAYTSHELNIPIKIVGYTTAKKAGTTLSSSRMSPNSRGLLINLYDSSFMESGFDESIIFSFILFHHWFQIGSTICRDYKLKCPIPNDIKLGEEYSLLMPKRNPKIESALNRRAGGTPTYSSMIYSARSFSEFIKKSRVDIVNYILLTDGIPDHEYLSANNESDSVIQFKVDNHILTLSNNRLQFHKGIFRVLLEPFSKAGDTYYQSYENFKGIWGWLKRITESNGSRFNSMVIHLVSHDYGNTQGEKDYIIHMKDKELWKNLEYDFDKSYLLDLNYDLKNFRARWKRDHFVEYKKAYGGVVDSVLYSSLLKKKGWEKNKRIKLQNDPKKLSKKDIKEKLGNNDSLSKHPVLQKFGELIGSYL